MDGRWWSRRQRELAGVNLHLRGSVGTVHVLLFAASSATVIAHPYANIARADVRSLAGSIQPAWPSRYGEDRLGANTLAAGRGRHIHGGGDSGCVRRYGPCPVCRTVTPLRKRVPIVAHCCPLTCKHAADPSFAADAYRRYRHFGPRTPAKTCVEGVSGLPWRMRPRRQPH